VILRKILGIFVAGAVLWLGLSAEIQAEEIACPQKIAFIQKDSLSTSATNILRKTYYRLGCRQTEFVDLPGRRGIHLFNHQQVDGEVYRLAQAEALYTRKFVRSEEPLFGLTSSLWLHPGETKIKSLGTGYILGVVWMEKHLNGRKSKAFHSAEDMFEAYNAGLISGFLAADFSVGIRMASNELKPSPVHAKTLHDLPLFHYLGKEFAPFMAKFSKVLTADEPFKALSLQK